MKQTLLLFILVMLVRTVYAQKTNARSELIYHIEVQITPDSSGIDGITEIQNPKDSVFFLAKGLSIQSIIADGKKTSFRQTVNGESGSSVEISLDKIPEKVTIYYSGKIIPENFPNTISSINMISKDLTELSNYIDWYPRLKNNRPFKYIFTVGLPGDYVTITTGKLIKESEKHGRKVTIWQSTEPKHGITFVSAPDIKSSIVTSKGSRIEIYYSKLPVSYIDSMKENLLRSVELLTSIFGSSGNENLIRLFYSPRSSWAYSRAPLILVSESYALEQRLHRFGTARDFHLNTHEISHLWSKANTHTPDDWLNEGLAEFSALMISEVIFGRDFKQMMINEYTNLIENCQTETSILKTENDSPDREINRYFKPTLLFEETRQKYGNDLMNAFLRQLYSRFSELDSASTPLFLEVCGSCLGEEAKLFFSEALSRENRRTVGIDPDKAVELTDSLILGTWEGPLSQFGTTTKFVIRLASANGFLVPYLDSPDQNAWGIPVSDFRIDGDTISYKLGMASAEFRGKFDENGLSITGLWIQRGIEYPLLLKRLE
jgi:hypothetical protein